MLFHGQKKSGLVRLSDCLKDGLINVAEETEKLNQLYHSQKHELMSYNEMLAKLNSGEIKGEEAIELIRTNEISLEADKVIALQSAIHNQCLTTIISTCFTLESYINSFAYYLSKQCGPKWKIKGEYLHDSKYFSSLRTIDKWRKIVEISTGKVYKNNSNDNPFGDVRILFSFRNDHAHDNVVEVSFDKSEEIYNGKLPDPVSGSLDIFHVLFAVDTYWYLIQWVHNKIGVSLNEFHMHYNLSPWISSEMEKQIRNIAATYNSYLENYIVKT